MGGDLTRNFDFKDYACRDGCGLCNPHPLVVCGVQSIRDRLRTKVFVTSGSRCEAHNEAIGGTPGSMHTPHDHGYTMAADLVVPGVSLREMLTAAEMIEQFRDGGIGLYGGAGVRFIHVDVRHNRARWYKLDGKDVDISTLLAHDDGRRMA